MMDFYVKYYMFVCSQNSYNRMAFHTLLEKERVWKVHESRESEVPIPSKYHPLSLAAIDGLAKYVRGGGGWWDSLVEFQEIYFYGPVSNSISDF